MQLFSTEGLEGTTIKKEGVPVQFSISLFQDLLFLFSAKYVMEETALPSATLQSNTEQSQKLQIALSPFPNSIKRKRRIRKGCKDLTQSKNDAQAGKMVAPLKATYFQQTTCELQPGFFLADTSPVVTFVTKDVFQGCQRAVCWGTCYHEYRYETNFSSTITKRLF